MQHAILKQLESPDALREMSLDDLQQLSREIRDVLCNIVASRSAHFASNLGVVELLSCAARYVRLY